MVTIGPLGDFGNLRWLMLMATLCVWGTVYSCFLLITSSSSYLITLILGMIGSTSYIFSLRSLLNAYIPMLAFAHHEIAGQCLAHLFMYCFGINFVPNQTLFDVHCQSSTQPSNI